MTAENFFRGRLLGSGMSSEEEMVLRKMMLKIAKERSAPVPKPCPKGSLHVDRDGLEQLLRECKVVLADFWAEWCGPCRTVEPIVEELAQRFAGKVAVTKINVDENSDLAFEHGVMSIPTIIIFNKGKEHKRFVGYYPGLARELARTLESLLS